MPGPVALVALFVLAAAALVLGVPVLRRALLTRWIMPPLARAFPRIGETERAALAAGTVGFEGELFAGRPDWQRLLGLADRPFTGREQAFLDGPVRDLCARVDDDELVQRGELPPEVWEQLKRDGFLGLIIPPAHGGLGFSARAHGEVVARLATRSLTLAVTVMVPNSLGPAELLMHYGTDAQKRHWLPRLARGEEIPCFALTGPENGSDAAAMAAEGVVVRSRDGELGLRLAWDKRYTTLGPVATVIGLAFRLKDPERLLGGEEDLGITVALVPATLGGVEIGARHDPLGVPFWNGPNRGRDVHVPLDAIIGGRAMAGQGWRMLMDCLSAGRGISLPSSSTGGAQLVSRLVSAHALVRRQFDLPIGRFEGVQERLARIAGMTWLVDALRQLAAAEVDAGGKPSVLTAVAKTWTTEMLRTVVNDGMDVLAGAGISRGPRNPLARLYQSAPIGITVEGANILTRSLIVFGQGVVRCHPFVQAEMDAAAKGDLVAFDRAFFGHVLHAFRITLRAGRLAFFGGAAPAGVSDASARQAFRRLSRLSAAFAVTAEMAMTTVGGALKRREMLSGRLADALAWMLVAAASLRRFVREGEDPDDVCFFRWGTAHALHQTELALGGVIDNLPSRGAAGLLSVMLFPLGRTGRSPSDKVTAAAAAALLESPRARDRLTRLVSVPGPTEPGLGLLEAAWKATLAAVPAERKLKEAQRAGREAALSDAERELLRVASAAQQAAIAVDAFDAAAFARRKG